MELRDYLHFKRLFIKDFAKSIGASPTYISQISNGYIRPGKNMALAIEKATNGEVTFNELMSITPKILYDQRSQRKLIEELRTKIEELEREKELLNQKITCKI